jgi:hypothetical protein
MMADGRLGKCKPCTREDVRANRAARAEQYNQYDRQRKAAAPPPKKRPEVERAGRFLRRAIKNGDVVPWPVCFVPECSNKPEGHHPDYGQPFDVVWLCRAHHQQAHAVSSIKDF